MNKVKQLRVEKGLTLKDLAKTSGIGIASLARLEAGGKAYASTLGKLARALEVNINELMEFEASGPYKGQVKPPPAKKKEVPPPGPVEAQVKKFRFTGQNKDNGWRLARELDLTISPVKTFMAKLPGVETMPYDEIKKLWLQSSERNK